MNIDATSTNSISATLDIKEALSIIEKLSLAINRSLQYQVSTTVPMVTTFCENDKHYPSSISFTVTK